MRSDAEAIAPRAHGGIVDDEMAKLAIDARDVLDFSVNVNPYGPTPAMLAAIRNAPVDRYPDPTSSAARRAIAQLVPARASEIVIGNGAVELMWTIALAYVKPGHAVVIAEPTFSEFRAAAALAGATIVEARAREEDAFAIDLARIEATVRRARAGIAYVCAPANPTGSAAPIADLAAFAARIEGTLLLLDQSFLSLSDRYADAATRLPPNVICVRSLTKDHAIPGLRAGYLIAGESIAERIEASRPPWTTSAPAQAAIVAAMNEEPFVAESRDRLLANRARLTARLCDAGFTVVDSSTVYVLVRVQSAADVRARLLARDRILVRDCTSFGLPSFIRVCARPAEDEERLVRALVREVRS
jgi:histidinol-phosphate aminotransferase